MIMSKNFNHSSLQVKWLVKLNNFAEKSDFLLKLVKSKKIYVKAEKKYMKNNQKIKIKRNIKPCC